MTDPVRRCRQCAAPLPEGSTQRIFCCERCAKASRRAIYCTNCRCRLLRPSADGMCGFCSPSFDLEAELAIHSPRPQERAA